MTKKKTAKKTRKQQEMDAENALISTAKEFGYNYLPDSKVASKQLIAVFYALGILKND